MAINFPSNPTTNQLYTNSGRTWIWTGVYWKSRNVTAGYTGSKGEGPYANSDTAPLNPTAGDRWFNTAAGIELVWTVDTDGGQWVEVAAEGFKGARGYTGSQGRPGSYGQIGYTGSAGSLPGYTGSIGVGYTGSFGYTGSLGNSGQYGFTGSVGSVAAFGYTGSLGTNGTTWQSVQTNNFTAISGYAYPIDTTLNAIYVTLPQIPIFGDIINLIDYAGNWSTNPVVVQTNNLRINGTNAPAVFNTNRLSVSFVYTNTIQGWIPYFGFNLSNTAVNFNFTYTLSYLVVAGGGGGGGGNNWGGGGGAGGLLTGNLTVNNGITYNISVGGGGAGSNSGTARGSNGSPSSFDAITTLGGGGGGSWDGTAFYPQTTSPSIGATGGSGGGASSKGSVAAAGTSGQGNAGGTGISDNTSYDSAGGGGGAGYVGSNGGGYPGNGGNGGGGLVSTITGSAVTYAGGGGGGSTSGTTQGQGKGGAGGGGDAGYPGINSGNNGTANRGGGGGGTGNGSGTGGSGGSGVVILSVPTAYFKGTTTGNPTVSTSGSNTILTYTQSGSYTA